VESGKTYDGKMAAVQKVRSIDIIENYTVRVNLNEWDSTFEGTPAMNTGMILTSTVKGHAYLLRG
jgi:hypothetical protein